MDTRIPTKIAIVGAGAVGSSTAYTLLLRERATELVLIDVNADKARGDALDMAHGSPFYGATKVWAGSYEDCAGADIVIITAGVAQRPGETRQALLDRNAVIFHAILHEIVKYNQNAILLVATNPVDVLSHLSWKLSGFSAERVIGTGTLLDSARFRYFIGQQLNVNPRSVHAHIVGEHGDSELPVWSRTNIAGVPIDLPESARATIFENTRNAAYEIIQAKGATSYAIALSIDRICTAILRDEGAVLNVSTLLNDYHGISDVYMGVPSVVARDGVREVIDLQPTAAELEQLRASAQVLRDRIAAVESLHPDWF